MNDILDRLCSVFESELERQENVLRLTQSQEQALVLRDTELLAARTQALNLLLNEAAQAEPERLRVAREAVEALALPDSQQTLSGVVAAVPDPWRSRLADLQHQLKMVMHDTALVVRRNNRMLQPLLHKTNDTIAQLFGSAQHAASGYTMSGYRDAATSAGTRLLDQAG